MQISKHKDEQLRNSKVSLQCFKDNHYGFHRNAIKNEKKKKWKWMKSRNCDIIEDR